MTGGFPVGTVCIGQDFSFATYRNGMECVIVHGLEMRAHCCQVSGIEYPPEPMYYVGWEDGTYSLVRPRQLRRKQPPTGEIAIMRMFDITAPAPREVEAA
jgi:hypothetical protein